LTVTSAEYFCAPCTEGWIETLVVVVVFLSSCYVHCSRRFVILFL